jgi:hypothetical protein
VEQPSYMEQPTLANGWPAPCPSRGAHFRDIREMEVWIGREPCNQDSQIWRSPPAARCKRMGAHDKGAGDDKSDLKGCRATAPLDKEDSMMEQEEPDERRSRGVSVMERGLSHRRRGPGL